MSSTWRMPDGSGDRWPDDYERGRPGWPIEATAVVGLPQTSIVLDLGAGTGKLTRDLVSTFARVVAVEPAEEMLRLIAAQYPRAEALVGTAHDIPLEDGSVDAVFAAQAFHWFDDDAALEEIARVLRPGGALVLMWNRPAGPWEPAPERAERLLTARMPEGDLGYIPLDLGGPRALRGWKPAAPRNPFTQFDSAVVPNPQTLDREGLVAFYATMGWIADLPDGERRALLDDVRSVLPAGKYRRLWETHVHWARLRPAENA